MKRNSLSTAVIAGIAGTVGISNLANAVNLNPDGLGQVLIYPYYTVNNTGSGENLQTLFSVVNTTSQGKAVKVRFVEGYNSREVRDFHLYLSPYDVWTANLFKLPGEEQANLLTADNSCTVPTILNAPASNQIGILPDGRSYLRFSNARFSGSFEDGGPTSLDRTREGHFEIIEMGTVTNDTRGSLDAITHVGGTPANCLQVNRAWSSGASDNYWLQNPNVDMEGPTGGLFGSALLLDLSSGVSAAYSADAIDGFITNGGNIHGVPGDLNPSLISVGGTDATATAYVFDKGGLIEATYGAGAGRKVDAISALFMQDNLFNEYVLDGAAAASTDWVVTFPTKRYYVDPLIVGGAALAPFVETFSALDGPGTGESKVQVSLFSFNREEGTSGDSGVCTNPDDPGCGVCFSPCDDPVISGAPVLRFEAQVISFKSASDFSSNPTSPVLGSQLASNVDVRANGLTEGWLRVGLNPTSEPHQLPASIEGSVFNGLPVTGFALSNFVNGNAAPGRLANYSGLWRHKGSRSCSSGTGACS